MFHSIEVQHSYTDEHSCDVIHLSYKDELGLTVLASVGSAERGGGHPCWVSDYERVLTCSCRCGQGCHKVVEVQPKEGIK